MGYMNNSNRSYICRGLLLVLLILMCFTFVGCSQEMTIYGTWKGSAAIYDGKEYTIEYMNDNLEEIAQYVPMSIFDVENASLVLTKSGNAVWTNPTDPSITIQCKYTVQDSVLELYPPSEPDDFFLLEYDGETIRFELHNITYVMSKE